jgi:signal transduction histidine kinase
VLMVVERHRGTIDFTTQAGSGTTFRISLPAFR